MSKEDSKYCVIIGSRSNSGFVYCDKLEQVDDTYILSKINFSFVEPTSKEIIIPKHMAVVYVLK